MMNPPPPEYDRNNTIGKWTYQKSYYILSRKYFDTKEDAVKAAMEEGKREGWDIALIGCIDKYYGLRNEMWLNVSGNATKKDMHDFFQFEHKKQI